MELSIRINFPKEEEKEKKKRFWNDVSRIADESANIANFR